MFDSSEQSQGCKDLSQQLLETMDHFIDDCTEKSVFDQRQADVSAKMVQAIKEFEAKSEEKITEEFFAKFESQTK